MAGLLGENKVAKEHLDVLLNHYSEDGGQMGIRKESHTKESTINLGCGVVHHVYGLEKTVFVDTVNH